MQSKKSIKIIRVSLVYSIVLLLLFPFLYLAIWTISRNWPWPYLIPSNFTFQAWRDFFFSDKKAWSALLNSFIIALGTMFLAIGISIPAAKALALYHFKAKEFVKLLVLAPIIIPPLAVTMGIHINFMRLGLSGSILGVMLVHLIPVIPYSIKILTHTFEGVGKKLEEQAQVLGANSFQRFFFITLPLIKPGIFSAAIMAFIISFSQYIVTFLMGEGRIITFPMLLFPLVNEGNRILASIYSWVFVLVVLSFTVVMERLLKNKDEGSQYFYL